MSARKRILCFLFVLTSFVGLAFGAHHFRRQRQLQNDLKKAEEEAKRGFWALAYDRVDRHRRQLIGNESDCNTLLNIYASVKKAERLDWASQACVENGIETLNIYLYMETAQELLGREQDALGLLNQLGQKFDKEAEPYRRMALILIRNKKEVEAADALFNAAMRTGDPQIRLDAIQLLLRNKKYDQALKVAIKVRGAKIDNPEAELIIARALILGDDGTKGHAQILHAREIMSKLDPEVVKRLERDYADVFGVEKKP